MTRDVLVSTLPCISVSILSEVKPPTGEPDAGKPPVRFGGRGGRNQSALPTPIIPPEAPDVVEGSAVADATREPSPTVRGLKPTASAPESAQSQRGESPLQAYVLPPVTHCNCVAARRGWEPPGVHDQPLSQPAPFRL